MFSQVWKKIFQFLNLTTSLKVLDNKLRVLNLFVVLVQHVSQLRDVISYVSNLKLYFLTTIDHPGEIGLSSRKIDFCASIELYVPSWRGSLSVVDSINPLFYVYLFSSKHINAVCFEDFRYPISPSLRCSVCN